MPQILIILVGILPRQGCKDRANRGRSPGQRLPPANVSQVFLRNALPEEYLPELSGRDRLVGRRKDRPRQGFSGGRAVRLARWRDIPWTQPATCP
jgi:hypothetical protein